MRIRLPTRTERAMVRAVVSVPHALRAPIMGQPPRSPEGFMLDPQVHALLWLMRVTGQPEMYEGDLEKARRRFQRSARTLDVQGITDVSSYDRLVPGGEGERRARVYLPTGTHDRPAPALVYFHGGGYTLGSIESHDGVCRGLASQAKLIVISVEYRLAPEYPFPAAPSDALAATRWVLQNARSMGADPDAVAVGGDSAGGCLATVVAQALRGESRRPAFQLLLYPVTDARGGAPSRRYFREGFMLTERATKWFDACYLPSPSLVTDPRASPLLASDLSGLSPALVLTAGFDPLRDEGREYAERMRSAGVEVESVCSESSVHGFMNMAGVLREPARLCALAARGLQRGLSVRRAEAASAA